MELPSIAAPVLRHQWLLLLPEGARYRYRDGALRPAPSVSPVVASVEETIVLTSEAPMVDYRSSDVSEVKTGRLWQREAAGRDDARARRKTDGAELDRMAADAFRDNVEGLRQGLVGGVRPLPVTIPQAGKALWLAGALPPAVVGVTLEVKSKR
jgi:hypothetical protein